MEKPTCQLRYVYKFYKGDNKPVLVLEQLWKGGEKEEWREIPVVSKYEFGGY